MRAYTKARRGRIHRLTGTVAANDVALMDGLYNNIYAHSNVDQVVDQRNDAKVDAFPVCHDSLADEDRKVVAKDQTEHNLEVHERKVLCQFQLPRHRVVLESQR